MGELSQILLLYQSSCLSIRVRDEFSVIPYSPLLPMTWEGPAKYPKEDPFRLDRDSRVEDICDFIMDYISTDILVRDLLRILFCANAK